MNLFDAMTEERRAKLLALGWKPSPFAGLFGLNTWMGPDGGQYSESEALAALARLEREVTHE